MTRAQIAALLVAVWAAGASAQSTAHEANRLTAAERAAGWRLLFDGATLDGWRGLGYDSLPTAHWRAADGAIQKVATVNVPRMADGQPANGGDLRTTGSYRDFAVEVGGKGP